MLVEESTYCTVCTGKLCFEKFYVSTAPMTCTVTKVINFLRFNRNYGGENWKRDTTRNISCNISFSSTFHVISRKFELIFGQSGLCVKKNISSHPTEQMSCFFRLHKGQEMDHH